LVPVTIEPCKRPIMFELTQTADLSGWDGTAAHGGWRAFLGDVRRLVGKDAAPSPSAPPPDPVPAAGQPSVLAAGNLPRRRGALIGREDELARIEALFEDADLVTVTGAGGVGKTRLALEFAHGREGRHEDGAWLVELAPLTDAGQVVGALARALGLDLPAGRDPLEPLIERLRPRDCLIVLDNCEHVIDAAAALAEAVMERTSQVKLLASSQEPLGVEGERVFRLRSLGEADAAALFVERARGADAGFAPKPRDEAAIAAICQRLDGIPLAVEMAAARAPALGCEGMLGRLDDRFRILTGGRRTALPRQRTLQATLDWSCGLLSAADAAVFRRLGVFTGGFTLEAASHVAAHGELDALEVTDAVASLVAKSLVVAETDGGRTRYRFLETTRMYALELLAAAGETAALQRRHAAYFAEITRGCRDDYYSLSDEALHARWAPEMANIEKAIDWAYGQDGDEALGLAIVGASWAAWVALSRVGQYLIWAEPALALVGPGAAKADVLRLKHAMVSAYSNTAPIHAPPLIAEILDDVRAGGDPYALGDLLRSAAMSYRYMGRAPEAQVFLDELAQVTAVLPPSRLTLGRLYAQAVGLWAQGDLPAMRALSRDGAELARSIGADGWANTMRWLLLEGPERHGGDHRIAETRDLLQGLRSFHMFSSAHRSGLTYLLAEELAERGAPGDIDEAYRLVHDLQKMTGRAPPADRWWLVLATMALGDGRPADGARLLGCAEEAVRRSGVDFSQSQQAFASLREKLAQRLAAAELQALAAEGARMSADQAYDLAMHQG
ncbi:MAG TPA: AAA family ATPase, partial [Caulobacteraceae bacterium]|nr:AAA family ATPase [Caulobacteraceae bacterium]